MNHPKWSLSQLQHLDVFILNAIADISELIALEDTNYAETQNHFGDNQLKIDVLADEIIFSNLKQSKVVKYGLSEEKPELCDMEGEHFIVAFDPLDGSSIIDVNWSVGTIYAVWPNQNQLYGLTPRQIITSGIAVYGPRTTVVRYNADTKHVEELTLKKDKDNNRSWIKTKDEIRITPTTKVFAPANLRATSDNKHYEELFEFWRKSKYTLRYTGGLVPDIYQIFIRGNGVFANPSSDAAPAKLRFLYEVSPVAFLAEKAGGKCTDGRRSIMDIEVENYTMRCTLCLGSADEVDRFERVVGYGGKPVRTEQGSPKKVSGNPGSPIRKIHAA